MVRSMRSKWTAGAAAVGFAALVVTAVPSPAAAAPVQRERFDNVDTVVERNFCDLGFDVRVVDNVRGTFILNSQRRDRLPYALENVHGTTSFTNLENDKSYTRVFNLTFKDLQVTDNGDGTLTILVIEAGTSKWYGPDGKLLFNDSGQVRFEVLIDHGGTPTDPSDDEFLEFLGIVKGPTGPADTEGRDFCADIEEFIG